jgi:pSer/pThr/pTyr-binding forkhead associated (FHA) protein
MGSSFRVVLRSGPTPGKVFPLEKNELFIGRDLSNDVVINDPEISRRHSRLFLQGGSYAVEDMGSTNGTSVNGQRLAGPYVLRSGDVLTFGERIVLAFEIAQTGSDSTLPGVGVQQNPTMQPAAPIPAPAYPPPYTPPPAYDPGAIQQPRPYAPPVQPPQQQPQVIPPQPQYQPLPQAQPMYPQVPPPQPAYEPVQQPFAGQMPIPPGTEMMSVRTKIPVWVFIVMGIMLLTILILVIDDFRLWYLFGFR